MLLQDEEDNKRPREDLRAEMQGHIQGHILRRVMAPPPAKNWKSYRLTAGCDDLPSHIATLTASRHNLPSYIVHEARPSIAEGFTHSSSRVTRSSSTDSGALSHTMSSSASRPPSMPMLLAASRHDQPSRR